MSKILKLLANKEFAGLITKITALISVILSKNKRDEIDDKFIDLIVFYITKYKQFDSEDSLVIPIINVLKGRIKNNFDIMNPAKEKIKEDVLNEVARELRTDRRYKEEVELVARVVDAWKELKDSK